jgi:Tfp pilus assembly protein PilX
MSRNAPHCRRQFLAGRARPRGVVLFVALIVMVVLALTAVALVRAVDTTTTVAGNLAFREASVLPANAAVEAAVAALFELRTIADSGSDDAGRNYFASLQAGEDRHGVPKALQRIADYPAGAQAIHDGNGNTVRWFIERMCTQAGPVRAATCETTAPQQVLGTTTSETSRIGLPALPLYRLSIRVDGPQGTVAFAQAMLR